MHILVSEINFKSTFFIPIVCKFWSTKFTLILALLSVSVIYLLDLHVYLPPNSLDNFSLMNGVKLVSP